MLQHRWIDEVSRAERERLQNELRTKLSLLARGFQDTIDNAVFALSPANWQIEQMGVEEAYAERFRRWEALRQPLFHRMAIALWKDGSLRLLMWDGANSRLVETPWPDEWIATRNRIQAGPIPPQGPPQANDSRSGFRRDFHNAPPDTPHEPLLIDVPRFGPGPPQLAFGHPSEDLLVELNLNYLRNSLFPDLLNRYVSDAGKLEYNAQVYVAGDPPIVIYQSEDWKTANEPPDGMVPLLASRGPGRGVSERSPERSLDRAPDRGPDRGPDRRSEPNHWRLAAYHRAGSLEVIVARARQRNLLVSSGLLLLILATAVLLVRVSQERERLAALQMNFVTGVSHELRTPLSVIRTAAFNLRGKLAHKPEQVENYGKLIQGESEKLATLVERVLLFARNQSGQVSYQPAAVDVQELVENAIRLTLAGVDRSPEVEVHLASGMPCAYVDRAAVEMALRNIIENALKYGMVFSNWIGISGTAVSDESGKWLEVRVADRGQGIPPEERSRIFDPFFRGERAQRDQIHGTGLGLNLAKSAIEANGGTIAVSDRRGSGTEFILRLPAAKGV